jgi:hypothetical protein
MECYRQCAKKATNKGIAGVNRSIENGGNGWEDEERQLNKTASTRLNSERHYIHTMLLYNFILILVLAEKFCSKHNISCDVELTPVQMVNEAYQLVLNSDVRYRFVIDMKSLNPSK